MDSKGQNILGFVLGPIGVLVALLVGLAIFGAFEDVGIRVNWTWINSVYILIIFGSGLTGIVVMAKALG